MSDSPDSAANRRRHPRYAVDISAKIEFYESNRATVPPKLGGDEVNETTGKFIWLQGEIKNVSLEGASVRVFRLSRKRYFELVRNHEKIYVKIHFKFPGENQWTKLFGRITWSDFHQTLTDVTNVGIHFQELLDADRARLEAFTQTLSHEYSELK